MNNENYISNNKHLAEQRCENCLDMEISLCVLSESYIKTVCLEKVKWYISIRAGKLRPPHYGLG